jgi:serine/threonine protein kinase
LLFFFFFNLKKTNDLNKWNLDSKGVPRTVSTKSLKKRRPASRPLGQILRTTDNNFIDFIRRCFELVFLHKFFFWNKKIFYFRWDPLERLTPEEGLRHPWIVETRLKRSSRESRTRYRAKKDDNNNNNNTSTINGDSCKMNF